MAVYTVTLRDVVRQAIADETGGWEDLDSQENWRHAYATLGLAASGNRFFSMPPYPIYSEDARAGLNDKIIRAHYMREIGFETVAQFAFRLNQALHEIMPYYNNLYQMKVLDAVHLIGADYRDLRNVLEGRTGTDDLDSKTTSESTSHSQTDGTTSSDTHTTGTTHDQTDQRMLDTPQTRFDALDDIYLTNAQRDVSDGTSDTTSNVTGSSSTTSDGNGTGSGTRVDSRKTSDDMNRTEETSGTRYDPTQFKNLLEIGQQLLNIDRMVVHDDAIEECFMLVY